MTTEIQQKKLNEIRPYEKNPRINDASVEAVAESIRQFGFRNPIIVDKDGVIIAGHTRYKAAKQLGLKTVPVIYASDLTPEQVQAYRLADNKVGETSMWDYDLLDIELQGITGIDMDLFGTWGEMPEFEEPEQSPEGEPAASGSPAEESPATCECPRCHYRFKPRM